GLAGLAGPAGSWGPDPVGSAVTAEMRVCWASAGPAVSAGSAATTPVGSVAWAVRLGCSPATAVWAAPAERAFSPVAPAVRAVTPCSSGQPAMAAMAATVRPSESGAPTAPPDRCRVCST
ncbi:hypothetical protein NJB1808_26540, partial [Mycobacterium marinum]